MPIDIDVVKKGNLFGKTKSLHVFSVRKEDFQRRIDPWLFTFPQSDAKYVFGETVETSINNMIINLTLDNLHTKNIKPTN